MRKQFVSNIGKDDNGTSVVEFGLIAMPLCIMIMGVMDLGHTYYVDSVLNGAMQDLARDSALEGSNTTMNQCEVDKKLKEQVKTVAPTIKTRTIDCISAAQKYARKEELERNTNRTAAENQELQDIDEALGEDVVVTRRYYRTFSDAAAARAEQWDERNNNNRCDNNEQFVDSNNNGRWDQDGGDSGQGGAQDVVIIKVQVKYKRLFPTKSLIGFGEDVQLLTDSILANQPYAAQQSYTPATTGNCT
jgi:Flp pilus assembly protein TadG